MTWTPAWTPTSTAHFQRLHAANKSYGDIAFELQQLGFKHITRNACVGKARRMKLHNGRTVGNYRNGVQNVGVTPRRKQHPVVPTCEPVEVMRPPTRGDRTGRLVDLDAAQCHWPMGKGPPFVFCTEDNDGSAYCALHHSRAITRALQ